MKRIITNKEDFYKYCKPWLMATVKYHKLEEQEWIIRKSGSELILVTQKYVSPNSYQVYPKKTIKIDDVPYVLESNWQIIFNSLTIN
jgi:hypothetical protein